MIFPLHVGFGGNKIVIQMETVLSPEAMVLIGQVLNMTFLCRRTCGLSV